MNLTNRDAVSQLMKKYGLSFNKSLGQNFLINENIPKEIAAYASENVLEIGPGVGSLTAELAAVCEKVVAVELDAGLVRLLSDVFADTTNISIIHADFLKLDLNQLVAADLPGGYMVCANLPYYITTPVILKLLSAEVTPHTIIVMVQKEVARRFTAPPGNSLYGAVAASILWYGTTERLFDVSPNNFDPRPHVDSTVIRITRRSTPPNCSAPPAIVRRLIRGAFSSRRKTLVNSLGSEFGLLSRDSIAEAVNAAGIAPNARGETLGEQEFAALADEINMRLKDDKDRSDK